MTEQALLRLGIALCGGLLLDAFIGDPVFRLHPVRLLGGFAARCERLSRRLWTAPEPDAAGAGSHRPAREFLAGLSAWLLVCALAAGAGLLLSGSGWRLHPLAGLAADSLLVWASVAPADLARHALRIRRAALRDLARGGEPLRARQAVALIVGRDVRRLDLAACCRAAVESVAESSVDGAAAALFWACLLGPWGALLYRAVNTMDSLFGHRNARYKHFGFIAARMDDLANCLPARLSSLCAVALATIAGGSSVLAWKVWRSDHAKHASPNAGHPESVYAGAFHLRLAGPLLYPEGWIDKPWLHPAGGECGPEHIGKAVTLMFFQTAASTLVFFLLRSLLPF